MAKNHRAAKPCANCRRLKLSHHPTRGAILCPVLYSRLDAATTTLAQISYCSMEKQIADA